MRQIVIVDAKNQVYRHMYGHAVLSTKHGFPTGAIHGCLSSMLAISKRLPDASFVWVWDGMGDTWRHRLMSRLPQLKAQTREHLKDYQNKPKRKPQGYKANRPKPDLSITADEISSSTDIKTKAMVQIPVLKMILEGSGFRNFEVPGLEGDDLVAILAWFIHETDDRYQIIIHSGDKDFYQTLAWGRVRILKGLKEGKMQWVEPEEVRTRFGVDPCDWLRYRALTGDSGDNISHLYHVGPKTALKMLDAGIDPAEPSPKHIDEEAKLQFARYFDADGIDKVWSFLVANYQLCRLITDPQDTCLSEEVKLKLKQLFHSVRKPRHLRRDKNKINPEAYRRVTAVLMKYELADIIAKRPQFWGMK